jgi:hypothetical protein
MVPSSSKMEARLAGLANVRNARPLAPARLRYAPLMQPQRKLLTSTTSLAVSLMRATLFPTSTPPPSSTMTMMRASSGPIILPQNLPTTLNFAKTQFVSGSKTTLSTSSICPGSSFLPTSSLRKCAMAHTSGNSRTLSCPVSLNF